MPGWQSSRLRVLELEPVRAKRSRPGALASRRYSSPPAAGTVSAGSLSARQPVPPSPPARAGEPVELVRIAHSTPLPPVLLDTPRAPRTASGRLPPLVTGALVSRPAAGEASPTRPAAPTPTASRVSGELPLPPPLVHSIARPHAPDMRAGLPAPWQAQRPHRRRTKHAVERAALATLALAPAARTPATPAASCAQPPSLYVPRAHPVATPPIGQPDARAPRRSRAYAERVDALGAAVTGEPALVPPAGAIMLPLDALREWATAGDVTDFADEARKHLEPSVLARPLHLLAEAALMLRANVSSARGLSEAVRAVVGGLRFHVELTALAYAAGLPQSKLWAELLAWHDRHGEQPSADARAPHGAGAPGVRAAQAEHRRRFPSDVSAGAHAGGSGAGAGAGAGAGTDGERPMQRTPQTSDRMLGGPNGSRAADALVATSRGATSTSSSALRQRLGALAAAANGMRRTLRVKIEDEQDLALAWKALLECSVFLSRLHAEAAAEAVSPVEKLAQLAGELPR
ncbi:hypothetical protein KFE25_006651 [Diacronema lutheri]|uniref:Uncharacterized protein n=1 Tax=Diacronema lutheri TaxID=2081491 RepID=A0A8J5XW15_DIALT|nr:hypothetical protein KFE25_006651 [Diacronema lutheri]